MGRSYSANIYSFSTGNIDYRQNAIATDTSTTGSDLLQGSERDDIIYGLAGYDWIIAGSGNDTLYGGDNDDTLEGGAGDDTLYGDNGNDWLEGNQGNDTLIGGAGDDVLVDQEGDNTLIGGEGFNILLVAQGNNILQGGSGTHILFGGLGNDYIDAGNGYNQLYEFSGNNTLISGSGNDRISLYGGNNIGSFGGGNNTITIGGKANVFNNLVTEGGKDTFTVTAGNNTVSMGAGNDLFSATQGNNTVDDGAGNDRVIGGEGSDKLHYDVAVNRGFTDYFDGGLGRDTLLLRLDATIAQTDWYKTALADFAQAMQTNPGGGFNFSGYDPDKQYLQLQVQGVEVIEQEISGLVNDLPKQIELSNNQINENSVAGTVVGTITSINEAGETPTFSLVGNSSPFQINPNTGVISVAQGAVLDFENVKNYNLTVEVNDGRGGRVTQEFTINLNDVNEAPKQISLSNNTINENSAAGTVVGTVSSLNDAGETPTYSLIGKGFGPFTINATTGVISLTQAALDFETTKIYNLNVGVNDGKGNLVTQTFAVNVQDLNEAPKQIGLSYKAVSENSAAGTIVGTVTSRNDAGETPIYSLVGNSGPFQINAATGVISVASGARLDFETTKVHNITVGVNDGRGNQINQAFSINVLDINEAPTQITISKNSINENAAAGTVVGTISSVNDAGETPSYSLVGNSGPFVINASTGVISVATGANLDFETLRNYDLTVGVSDGKGNLTTQAFTVNILDINEAPNQITLSNNLINENASAGTVLGTVTSQNDAGETPIYSLIGNSGPFVINASTGVISVAPGANLDFETIQNYNLTVGINDAKGNQVTQAFTVNVLDVNEAPKGIILSNNLVQENSAAGTVVGTVSSFNDAGETPTYSIIGSSGPFTIDATTGLISVAPGAVLNYEALPSYSLNIGVSDGRGNLTTQSFVINVQNVNEGPTAVNDGFGILENGLVNGNLFANNGQGVDSDPENDRLTLTEINGQSVTVGGAITLASGAVVIANPDGTFSYDPKGQFNYLNNGESAQDGFSYKISDGNGNTATANARVDIAGISPVVTPPVISVSDARVAEGAHKQSTYLEFDISLSHASSSPVTLNYATSGDTASGLLNADFVHTNGLLTFAAGETVKRVSVEVLGDNAYEASETMRLNIFKATGGTIGDALGVGTIDSTDPLVAGPLVAPILNSNINATYTIYLDFDGSLVENTSWNARYTNGAPINATAFSMDSDVSNFSTADRAAINEIWSRVSEDYRPFNVNVTTDAAVYASTDSAYRLTAVITESSAWYPNSAGGVATVGIIGFGSASEYYKPAWVFSNVLSSAKSVGEAVSHELGHNMGLTHDGTPTAGYYTGHGSGETGWAPIMGVGYYQPVTQWSKGDYAGGNNIQDDMSILSSRLGYRADDYGDTMATAGILNRGLGAAAEGIIEQASDVDLFKFEGQGTFTLTINPLSVGANLDIMAVLKDSLGTVLAQSNNTTTLNASLSYTSATAQEFYLEVSGVGNGGTATTGYTDYASVGYYRVDIA